MVRDFHPDKYLVVYDKFDEVILETRENNKFKKNFLNGKNSTISVGGNYTVKAEIHGKKLLIIYLL